MTWTTRPRSEGAGKISFWRAGQGAPLVLIHGVGLRAEAWAAIGPMLDKDFTVYAVDMPGHGGSPLNNAVTLQEYVTRICDFVQALDAPVCIAGHSMGAMIALELAGQMPDRVLGVAALNAIYRRTPDAARAVQARANALNPADPSSPDATLERWFGAHPQGALADSAEACRDWLTRVDPQGYAAAYRVFAHHDGPDNAVLRGLPMPALFQTGPGDLNSTPDMSRSMAALVPQGRAEIVPDAAHMMPMTHPDAVAQALLQTFGQTK
ncbi:alpha/beta fold hydrolase [Marivita sp. S6314]|uniref:alpha/beta fold hydrolase n=1 Tax=Marivita sp. S6314 TaxID=2926406 RepID=UPI001FF4C22B|nr:alpha/beta fold hydrolase [Marivita sp. S6314]MCK0149823.1 alpha/beta fold hydrolase [Marivita sp. S6314]